MQSVEKPIPSSDKQDGVITCFLCLVLLVILSLISVTLESARSAAGRFFAESYTRLAADSVMAAYSGALFDRYHLFAYNSRSAADRETETVLERRVEYYINRNLQAENRMLWKPVLQKTDTLEFERLTDETGEVFRREAVEYMKYRGAAMVMEHLLASLGVFQGAEKTTKLLETKAETEESLSEIDRCILELFESVDGFVRDETGIKQNIWGKVKIKRQFVKKLFFGAITAERAQINHAELFEAVKEHYVNPAEVFSRMEKALTEYETAMKRAQALDEQMADLAASAGAVPDPSLGLVMAALGAERAVRLAEAELARAEYLDEFYEWKTMIEGCREAGRKAILSLLKIRQRQELAKSKVLQYEGELLAAAGWLDDGLQAELAQGLQTMKDYVGLDIEGEERLIDVDRMEETLTKDVAILSRMISQMEESSAFGEGFLENGRMLLSQMREEIRAYSHEGLCFDYSGLKLKAEGKSPVQGFRELIISGIAGLVLPDETVPSEQRIMVTELPSRLYGNVMENTEHSGTGRPFEQIGIETIGEGNGEQGVAEILGSMNRNSPLAGIAKVVRTEGEALLERVLFLSYLAEHFDDYETISGEDSVLEYEKEYILCGRAEDEANLYEVIARILLVRLVFQLIHVLSDAEKCSVAGETAMGLLGVTGLPVLVSILKFAILFVWATEAALVDTAAILRGKKIALIPAKEDFPVGFSELLLMSKARIQQKAELYKEKGQAAFGYAEYLMLFLFLQDEEIQSMRALDLIQENTALEDPGFRAGELLCSFRIRVEYRLPELFTRMPFSKRRTGEFIYSVTK